MRLSIPWNRPYDMLVLLTFTYTRHITCVLFRYKWAFRYFEGHIVAHFLMVLLFFIDGSNGASFRVFAVLLLARQLSTNTLLGVMVRITNLCSLQYC